MTGSRSSRTPGPVLHAIHYLLGSQSREALENFRGFGGAQSYPSRTKDSIPVDFSTGSVGLGVAITLFSSLIQDYLTGHGRMDEADRGRFVALVGDAELDEGNIYEALIEGAKHDVRNLWWVLDYNRQSLDAVSADKMFERFDDIFRACGWRVVELKYGKRLAAELAKDKALKAWFDSLPNADLSALHYQGGAAIRARLENDLGSTAFLKANDDAALLSLFSDLGGHCMESLVEAFDEAVARRRADPVHRLDDQGPRPPLRRAQGQSFGADEPDPDGRAARLDGRARRP